MLQSRQGLYPLAARAFVSAVVLLFLATECSVLVAAQPADDGGQAQAKRARIQAARKERRIIFNCDGGRLWMDGTDTVQGFLAPRLQPLVGTQVDTIFLDIVGGDAPLFDSRVQPVYGIAQGRDALPNLKALIEAGHCPLRIVTDFAHDNGIEAFASIRMNDVHDSFIQGHIAVWKKQHPEMLVDKRESLPSMQLYVTAQDFSHQAVRDRKFEIIEEVCERYDVDGIELDYFRHPVLFIRTMRGLPVTDDEVQIMTSFTRRIRQHLDEVAAQRGRPVLLAVRVPDTFELARKVGLDVKTWLEEDLVDILIAGGGYAHFTLPVKELAEVAHQYGVPVYPCMNQGPAREISQGNLLEGVRAMASNWHRAGADGVYTFNLFAPFDNKYGEALRATRQEVYACLHDIGDPKTLHGKDKLYCIDNKEPANYWFVSSTPPLPMQLKQGEVRRVSLLVGDDVQAAAQAGTLAKLELTLSYQGPVSLDTASVKLNGQPLTCGDTGISNADQSNSRIVFLVDAPPLRMGENVIEASIQANREKPVEPVQIDGVHLWVRYKGT